MHTAGTSLICNAGHTRSPVTRASSSVVLYRSYLFSQIFPVCCLTCEDCFYLITGQLINIIVIVYYNCDAVSCNFSCCKILSCFFVFQFTILPPFAFSYASFNFSITGVTEEEPATTTLPSASLCSYAFASSATLMYPLSSTICCPSELRM